MRTGHYLIDGNDDFSSLRAIKNLMLTEAMDTEDDERGFYDNADAFRMGRCDLFSLALNQVLGLRPYLLIRDTGSLVHACCIEEIEGVAHFIDVRGITSDKSEFLRGFHLLENVRCDKQDVEQAISEMGDSDRFGFEFAKKIIRDNLSYYSCREKVSTCS